MLTVRSLGSTGAVGYAEYLDSKTVVPERGDYYLGRDGEPVEAPGRWLARPESLRVLSIDGAAAVGREDLVALMQGRRPGCDEFMRRAASNGVRNAGVDATFSAPKSVSVAWALGSPEQRAQIEQLHHQAVQRAVAHLRVTAPLAKEWDGSKAVEVPARDVLAAEFLHTTARGLKGQVPDPQLHSHVVVTSIIRRDGQVAAVRDRALYRAAREGGAYYRAALAEGLVRAGYEVERGTGKGGRYFELAGTTPAVLEAFSGRAREITRAVRGFEAREGRKPSENELQLLKVGSRERKQPQNTVELSDAWHQTATDLGQAPIAPLRGHDHFPDHDAGWSARVEASLTAERATFSARELRAAALEHGTGALTPDSALHQTQSLMDHGRLVALDGGRLTTRTLRALEHSITEHTASMAQPDHHTVPLAKRALQAARDQAAERIGSPLSVEQERALRALCGPERIAALEGQAGTGKGVVIDALARAERMSGRQVVGLALAGATAQRLGEDSPALARRTTTIASLLARHDRTGQEIDEQTTVIVDEAGMVDTPTLARLVRATHDSGGRLIVVGDGKQLPAIGPGGMFDQLTRHCPRASLNTVRRTTDPEERKAWRALRNGKPEHAMAHYMARGQLHLSETRDHALEHAAQRHQQLAERHGLTEVALMSDGSTSEINRLNSRVQHLRRARGEIGPHTVTIPGDDSPHYGLSEGDLITWRQIQKVPGDARIENGTRGLITRADPQRDEVTVALVGSNRHVNVIGPDQLAGLRLGYAQHVVRQQGATVERAVAVTGGWQTSREAAYVQASRARHGIDWYVARDQLGEDGTDVERLHKLAQRMAASHAKTPSIAHEEAGPGYDLAAGCNLSTDLDGPTIPRPAPDLRIDNGIDR